MYKRDDAVSPVIGVILMVAITVILAAVIAAFVFGMAGNVQKTKSVAFTVERSAAQPTQISITNQGGKDVQDLSSVFVLINGNAPTNSDAGAAGTKLLTTGRFVTTGSAPAGQKTKVTITAKFKDGSTQVIVDTQV